MVRRALLSVVPGKVGRAGGVQLAEEEVCGELLDDGEEGDGGVDCTARDGAVDEDELRLEGVASPLPVLFVLPK